MVKLHIGCGTNYLNGYINIDSVPNDSREAYRKANIDLIADVLELDKHFEEESIDEILCNHMIEHVSLLDVHHMFAIFNKILKRGGTFELRCPDFEGCVKAILNQRYDEQVNEIYYRHIFGSQVSQTECHLNGFTKARLHWFLLSYGFESQFMETEHIKRDVAHPHFVYERNVTLPDLHCIAYKMGSPKEEVANNINTPQNYRNACLELERQTLD
jgi:predicted SAM-dependent methyltransferase